MLFFLVEYKWKDGGIRKYGVVELVLFSLVRVWMFGLESRGYF